VKQNVYDDPAFFAEYAKLRRYEGGLNAALEWPAFETLLPSLEGSRVLDLGCGFGRFCRHARERGAAAVVGIDLSERMLERAGEQTNDAGIEYRRSAIEDASFLPDSFDLAVSSLALHYIERYDAVCRNVARWLKPRGAFVFSVEHPICTALLEGWCLDERGGHRHWPVDDYRAEGKRERRWFIDGVIKFHRTFETYLNTLIDCGFTIARVLEPEPTAEFKALRPDLVEETRRPAFLLISATRN
jgi:SAM-dependent methyltransferase